MNISRRWMAAAATALALGGSAVAWAGVGPAGAAPKNLSVFVTTGNATNHTDVDATGGGFGDPGDYFVENTPVLDRAGGEVIGHADTIVTLLNGDAGNVICTVVLAGGSILFEGGFDLADVATGAVVPVTGGTGRYGRAVGTATIVQPTADGATVTFDLNG